jgi:hypothetical protein
VPVARRHDDRLAQESVADGVQRLDDFVPGEMEPFPHIDGRRVMIDAHRINHHPPSLSRVRNVLRVAVRRIAVRRIGGSR